MISDKEKTVIDQVRSILFSYNLDSLGRSLDVLVTSTIMGMGSEGKEAIITLIDSYHETEVKRRKALEIENRILKNTAFHDALAGIPNRRYLRMYLDALVRESEEKAVPVSLIALDLDNFKWVNDIYGHEVGDKVLERMKEILPSSLRGYDHVFLDKKLKRFRIDKIIDFGAQSGREGGEEFYVVLPNTTYEEALIVAERLRGKVKETFEGFFDEYKPIPTREKREDMPKKLKGLTASIGVSTTNKSYTIDKKRENIYYNVGALKQAADLGTYLAKKEGRDKVMSVCLDK